MILAPLVLTSALIQAKAKKVIHWYYEVQTITATVTAYDAQDFPGINASGAKPRAGMPIACPRAIKFGTIVTGRFGTRICDDRTARKYDGRFDLLVATREEAIRWGKRKEKITIIYNP